MILPGRTQEDILARVKEITADLNRQCVAGGYTIERLREELYMKQKAECPICLEWLKNAEAPYAELDHAVSKFFYASTEMSSRLMCAAANDLSNLVVVHARCNKVKCYKNLDEMEIPIEKKIVKTAQVTALVECDDLYALEQYAEPRYEDVAHVICRIVREYVASPTGLTAAIERDAGLRRLVQEEVTDTIKRNRTFQQKLREACEVQHGTPGT